MLLSRRRALWLWPFYLVFWNYEDHYPLAGGQMNTKLVAAEPVFRLLRGLTSFRLRVMINFELC